MDRRALWHCSLAVLAAAVILSSAAAGEGVWIAAFAYAIENGVTINLGEFGGFEQTKHDPVGRHHHYYANRGIVRVRADGSIQESLVQEAYRRYFERGGFEVFSK